MFSRSLVKDVKSLKNQFWTFLKYTLGIVAVSGFQISPALLRLKKKLPSQRAIPLKLMYQVFRDLFSSCSTAESPKNCTDSWHFLKKMRSRGGVLNRIFLPVLYICSVLPYPWTWYISFNIAVSYIYPNYSDLTQPHPKWRCGRGTPPTTGLISGKSRLVNYYNSTRFEFKQALIVLLKLNMFKQGKTEFKFNKPGKPFKHDYCESGWLVQTRDFHFFTMGNNHHHHHPSMPNATDQPRLKQEGEPEGKWKRPEVGQRGEERFNGFSGGSGFLQRFFCCKEFIGENDGKWMGWESPPRKKSVPRKISHLYGIYWVYIYIMWGSD